MKLARFKRLRHSLNSSVSIKSDNKKRFDVLYFVTIFLNTCFFKTQFFWYTLETHVGQLQY